MDCARSSATTKVLVSARQPSCGHTRVVMHVQPIASWICVFAFLTCSTAARAADPVVIVTPKDGAVVSTQFSVTVTYGKVDYCEDDWCEEKLANEITLRANGSRVVLQDVPEGSSEATLDVVLAPGQYVLEAEAEWSEIASELSEPIQITVVESATTGDTAGTMSGGSDSTSSGTTTTETSSVSATSSADPQPKSDGCACVAATSATPELLPLAAMAFLPRRRRRATTAGG